MKKKAMFIAIYIFISLIIGIGIYFFLKNKELSPTRLTIFSAVIPALLSGLFTFIHIRVTTDEKPSDQNGKISIQNSDSNNISKKKQTTTQTNNVSGNQTNENVMGDKVVNNYNITPNTKTQPIPANKTIIDQSVTSNNQTGGITAHTVIVPEDKEIEISKNYLISKTILESRNAFEIRPKQGLWTTTFVAYPTEEDSEVNGNLTLRANHNFTLMEEDREVTVKGKKYLMKVLSVSNPPATKDVSYFFCYEKEPSILIFGDVNDQRKIYIKN